MPKYLPAYQNAGTNHFADWVEPEDATERVSSTPAAVDLKQWTFSEALRAFACSVHRDLEFMAEFFIQPRRDCTRSGTYRV